MSEIWTPGSDKAGGTGLLILPNGLHQSEEVPSRELLGGPNIQFTCRCAGCKKYFKSDVDEVVCDDCKAKAAASLEGNEDTPNGNLPADVDRTSGFAEAVTHRVPRPKVQSEFGRAELEE